MADHPSLELSSHHHSQLVIPLISKRLNNVEKYINDFPAKTEELSRAPFPPETSNNTQTKGVSDRNELHHYRSAQLSPFLQQEQLAQNDRCCVKYNSILAQKSEERVESLSRLEKDYRLLKQRMHPDRRSPKAPFSTGKPKETSIIAQEDVDRQLKSSVVNENGKKYFADLYLLKKGREEIMNSLSGGGKLWVQERSYEEKVKSSEHDFVKHKILEEREVKRTKMLKGRNLHWNVYYDMLALSANEKNKLKGVCKFTSTFGIL